VWAAHERGLQLAVTRHLGWRVTASWSPRS